MTDGKQRQGGCREQRASWVSHNNRRLYLCKAVLWPTRVSAFNTRMSEPFSTNVVKTSMLNHLSSSLSIGRLRRDEYASQLLELNFNTDTAMRGVS